MVRSHVGIYLRSLPHFFPSPCHSAKSWLIHVAAALRRVSCLGPPDSGPTAFFIIVSQLLPNSHTILTPSSIPGLHRLSMFDFLAGSNVALAIGVPPEPVSPMFTPNWNPQITLLLRHFYWSSILVSETFRVYFRALEINSLALLSFKRGEHDSDPP